MKIEPGVVDWFVLAMRSRCPIPVEPEYASLQEALYFIRHRVMHISLLEMAAKLGITDTYLSNVESAAVRAVSVDCMEILQQLAKQLSLPKLHDYMYLLIISNRANRKGGRKKGSLTLMEDDEPQNRWSQT